MGSQSSFKIRTVGPAAERPVWSLKLEREIGLYPTFTYPSLRPLYQLRAH